MVLLSIKLTQALNIMNIEKLKKGNEYLKKIEKLQKMQVAVRSGNLFLKSVTSELPQEYLDRTVEILSDMLGDDLAKLEAEFADL